MTTKQRTNLKFLVQLGKTLNKVLPQAGPRKMSSWSTRSSMEIAA